MLSDVLDILIGKQTTSGMLRSTPEISPGMLVEGFCFLRVCKRGGGRRGRGKRGFHCVAFGTFSHCLDWVLRGDGS